MIFLRDSHREMTYQEFNDQVLGCAEHLKSLNLKENDLVLVNIKDPFKLVTYVFACMHLGIKPALFNHYFKEAQVESVLAANGYKMTLTDSLPLLKAEGDFKIPIQSELIFFTSGSIKSKACVLTLENFFKNAQGSRENIPYDSGDTWGLCLPLFHVGGFSILVRALLSNGTVAIIDNSKLVEQIKGLSVSHISLVSTQFIQFLESPIKTLKYILLGGSAIPEVYLKKAIELNLPIYKSYGMTEMASQICTTKQLTSNDDLQFSGHLLNYRDLKISEGKIFVKGPCLFKGYLKNNQLEIPFDDDGWFFTKDCGEIHNGQILVKGREDRIFQSAGENISPEVIEQELLKIAGVTKAYVLPESDPKYGLRPVAYIEHSSEAQLAGISDLLRQRLPGLFVPKELRPWSENPKTSWKQ